MFLVPYNKLSEDQKAIIRRVSRENSDLFIEGPPGSGKTLISLYTLKDMVENQTIKPLLLIYNHSLYGYLSSAMKEMDLTDNVTIATKDKYFWDLARINNITPEGNGYNQKYIDLLEKLLKLDMVSCFDIAVVDEVQDLRQEEWQLIRRLAKRTTSLGDFDQGVYQTNLKKSDVALNAISEKLRDIFRFHKNIAKVAQTFSKSKGKLEDKVSRIEQKNVELVDVERQNEAKTIADIIQVLKGQKGRIGIISHNHDGLRQLQNKLQNFGMNCDYYEKNNDLRTHDFSSENPLLVTSYSAKGLEFEHVIVFGFNENEGNISSLRAKGELQDILYVTVTRANSSLYILRNNDAIDEFKQIAVTKVEHTFTLDDIF
jgi:DNA helicase IV